MEENFKITHINETFILRNKMNSIKRANVSDNDKTPETNQ